jgi:scavenger receptor class B protein 1
MKSNTKSKLKLMFFFSQKWIKENVTWHGNGTMSYQTRKEFKFVPELSSGNQETDIITTANVPAISAFYQMRKSGYFYQVKHFIPFD